MRWRRAWWTSLGNRGSERERERERETPTEKRRRAGGGVGGIASLRSEELQTSSEYLLGHMKEGHEVLSLSYNMQSKGLGSLVGTVGSLANASELAEALRQSGDPAKLAESEALKVASKLLQSDSTWPPSLPEPRVQARGPLGSLGDRGF